MSSQLLYTDYSAYHTGDHTRRGRTVLRRSIRAIHAQAQKEQKANHFHGAKQVSVSSLTGDMQAFFVLVKF